ncbi:MAG: preprotein translocase subunit SecE [Saprospiraceae bacterium]
MDRISLYLKESYDELMKNVSWPTFSQLRESTVVVLITSAILALIVLLMDGGCNVLFNFIYETKG